MRWRLSAYVAFALATPVAAQKPIIFDVSNVVVGAQKIRTLYLLAEGKWSDAGEHVGPLSTEINCYKSLGFCNVGSAVWDGSFGEAIVSLDDYDILRWDSNEVIAVDSSSPCILIILRVDLVTKRITLGTSDKGVNKDPFCKGTGKRSTAVLWGMEDIVKDAINRAKAKQQNH